MTDLEGIAMGLPPAHPRVRSGFQPKPFNRPRVDLDAGERREWRRIDAADIDKGDILPGVGVVDSITKGFVLPGPDVVLPLTTAGRPTPLPVTVYGGEGNVAVYDVNDVVLVFTKLEEGQTDQ